MKEFVPNQLVIAEIPDTVGTGGNPYPFNHGDRLIFLGEIVQMPGHCIVVNKDGRVLWGYHIDDFRSPFDCEV